MQVYHSMGNYKQALQCYLESEGHPEAAFRYDSLPYTRSCAMPQHAMLARWFHGTLPTHGRRCHVGLGHCRALLSQLNIGFGKESVFDHSRASPFSQVHRCGDQWGPQCAEGLSHKAAGLQGNCHGCDAAAGGAGQLSDSWHHAQQLPPGARGRREAAPGQPQPPIQVPEGCAAGTFSGCMLPSWPTHQITMCI